MRFSGWLVGALITLVACTPTGGRYVDVRPGPISVQMVPLEIDAALLDLGYERVEQEQTVVDWSPAAASELDTRKGSVIVTTDEYRTLYQSQADSATFVQVRIGRDDGRARLRLYETGRDALSEAGKRRLQAIHDRLAVHYGKERVWLK